MTKSAIVKLMITSRSFKDKDVIPVKYGYNQDNISPQLSWSVGPSGTKSYALICQDPDAPRTEPWVHWVVSYIPGNESTLAEGASEHNNLLVQGLNDYKQEGWGGPNPPSGTHRYFFTIYALDTILPNKPMSKKELLAAMNNHILAQGEIIGTYAADN